MARILLVDADHHRVSAIKSALEEAHYEVALASSTSFALTMLEWNRPTLVVSQAEMPEPDGYELCSIIRGDPSTEDLPFMLLVGPAGPAPGGPARAQVDGVLGGDLVPSDVVAAVRRLLQRVAPERKVLIVDDSAGVRTALELALQERHLTVLLASLGSEAFERIMHDQPDIVVCDVHLPDRDGYQVCEFVKKRLASRRVPVILMSGDVDESQMRAARFPPDDVMRKPFAPDELVSKIERLLAKSASASATARPLAFTPVLPLIPQPADQRSPRK